MSFRKAEFSDLPFIVDLLEQFYKRVGNASYGIPFCRSSTWITVHETMRNGVCVVGETSCAGALIQKFPFNSKALVAYVLFWTFKKPREIEIFEALMVACRKLGATHITAAGHRSAPAVSRHYANLGLKPCESYSMGGLDGQRPASIG